MRNALVESFEEEVYGEKKNHPQFRPGDTLRVHYKIEEDAKGDKKEKKYRIQVFEGVCLRFKKGGAESSFTVRKIGANSVGVERVFPLQSPNIASIELVTGGQVRRARLYYLRSLKGKAARIRARRLPVGFMTRTEGTSVPQKERRKRK